MAKNAAALAKAKDVKAAAKRVAAKVAPYKHEQAESDANEPSSTQGNAALGSFAMQQLGGTRSGVDNTPSDVVHSGFSSPNHQESNMTETTKQERDAEAAKAKIAAKEAKAKVTADAIADAIAKALARKQAREAAAEAAKAEGKKVRERTYDGSMLVLADRVKQGVYTKGLNGQLRSADELAVALESVPASKMVQLLMEVFQETVNKYATLNYGQQSMNYRNRLRGAIRKGTEVNGTKITIDYVKQVRDDGGYATVEADLAAKTEAKAAAKAIQGKTEPEAAAAAA